MRISPFFYLLLGIPMLLFSCTERKLAPKEETPQEIVAPVKEDAKTEHTTPKKAIPKPKEKPPERAIQKKEKQLVVDTLRPKNAR